MEAALLASILVRLLRISIILLVFAVGLSASRQDLVFLFKRPEKLLRSFVSMSVVMPVLAAVTALIFNLYRPVEIALVALAISPVPPLLPRKQTKAGGEGGYAIGLLVAMAVLAIVYIPLAIMGLDIIFPASLRVPFRGVVKLTFLTVLVPLLAGVVVRGLAAGFAERATKLAKQTTGFADWMVKPVSLVAALLLLIGLIPAFFKTMSAILSLIGNGTVLVFVAFVIVGLAVGHFLGGPAAEDRPVLALATASRHPAIAAAVGLANFPQERLIFPAILLYVGVSIVVCVPYIAWLKRKRASRLVASPF
jgi:BASS family bile acid:Na+ symporter